MRSFSKTLDGRDVEPPRIHPAQKWLWIGVFGALTAGQAWMTMVFIKRQPDDLVMLIGNEIVMEAAFAAFLWVAWKQCGIVLSQDGVTWGPRNARRFIAWKDAKLQADGLVVIVRSGRETLKINSAHYSQAPFWRFFAARFPDLHDGGQ